MITIHEGTPPEEMPTIVRALAKASATERVPDPKPIKWRMSRKEDEGEWMIVIIFEHGPTLMWTEAQVTEAVSKLEEVGSRRRRSSAASAESGSAAGQKQQIDPTDGISQTEATTAGKTLAQKKAEKKAPAKK